MLDNYFRVVKKLDYSFLEGDHKPIFSQKIGLYDSLGARVLILSDDEWHNYFSSSSQEVREHFLDKISIKKKKTEGKDSFLPPLDKGEIYMALTEACNLACPGCAVGIDKIKPEDARFLSLEQVFSYLQLFFQSAKQKNMREVHIKWAGGEPLMKKSYKLIVDSQDKITELSNFYGIEQRQTILTNGVYISDEVIDFCDRKQIHLSVSLWGTAKYQDKMRRPRSGQESYSAVVANLEKLAKNGNSLNVNYVLAPDNAEDFADFIRSMWDVNSDAFIGKKWEKAEPIPLGITFFRPTLPYKKEVRDKLYGKMIAGMRAGFAVMVELLKNGQNLPPLNKIDYLDFFSTRITTCGSGRSYLAAGLDGMANCHHALPELKLSADDGEKSTNIFEAVLAQYKENEQMLSVNNMDVSSDLLWLKYHGLAGCPRLAQLENKQELGHLSSLSEVYSQIADEVLSLETMRQMVIDKNEK